MITPRNIRTSVDAEPEQIRLSVVAKKEKDSRYQVNITHCSNHQKQGWDINNYSWRTWYHSARWCLFERWTVLIAFVVFIVVTVMMAGLIFAIYYEVTHGHKGSSTVKTTQEDDGDHASLVQNTHIIPTTVSVEAL
ncbi:hypothetical protein GGS21DRAFT_487137 [Xylaria nigripes]|nr:hypothetical protein GGS21DRAFT_487137 [Xylaria nigripes]